MRSLFLPFIFLSFGLAASESDPVLSRRVTHERRSHIPTGWSKARKHDPSAVLPLRFGLAQSNLERLEDFLYDVSHPNSPNYGKHWSAGRVASTFAPSRHSVDAVRTWLVESGVESHRIRVSASRGWLEFKATVREAEDLLGTTYNVYGHETGAEHVACERYHLPEHLTPHVDFVTPTVHFDARLSKRSGLLNAGQRTGLPSYGAGLQTIGQVLDGTNMTQLETCDTHMTPACLRALYEFDYEPQVPEKNSFGVSEFTPRSYNQGDLDLFAQSFGPDLVGVSPIFVSIDGGTLSTDPSFANNGEANLDLEYAMNLVTAKQNVTVYQLGDAIQGASFNNFLDALDGAYCTFEGGDDPVQDGVYPDNQPGGYTGPDACGTVKPANVIATSYGYNEADFTPFYTARQCAEYAKLGLMGVTMIFSSGDRGVAGNGANCSNPDGTQSPTGKIFDPGFPDGCPYITSVGATQIIPGNTVNDPESAVTEIISSGGGWSNRFALPDYQKDAVTWYLKNNPPAYPSDIWNSTGKSRASPDLSANGAFYVIAVEGNFSRVFGTSAAAPVVGAMVTMINDARIAQGKSTVGFINPTIYSPDFADAFNDITNGTNPGCGTLGFNTSRGWDPVTGLGTPNFRKLLAKWLELP